MSRDSHGNPSQPHCVSVSWLIFICRPEYLLVCSLCRKKFGHSFCLRRWAERADACSSGGNASLPILGLCHSLRPEWKHGFKWLTSGC